MLPWQSLLVGSLLVKDGKAPLSFASSGARTVSLGGHDPKDEKHLTVIDVNPYKKGILPPDEFLKLFGEFGPNYLGNFAWDGDFIQEVKQGEVEGVTFEGVVGKRMDGKQLLMYKLKTQQWIDKVLEKFGTELGGKIIRS